MKSLRIDILLITLIAFSWVLLTTYTFQLTAPGWAIKLDRFFSGDKVLVKNLFLSAFFLTVFLFFRDLYNKEVHLKIKQVEWRVLVVSIVCLSLNGIIIFLEHYVTKPVDLAVWHNALNNFNILIGTIFCGNCFYYFKKLILFQRNLHIDFVWRVFEYFTFATISITVFNVDVTEYVTFLGLTLYASIALYLSTKMKWVAFLSQAKKIKSLLRFLVFFIIVCIILQNFFFESFTFGESATNHLLVIDCAHKFFLLATFTFVTFYSISSILILLFNLPTSSAFQQKVNNVNDYKKLSQVLHTDRDETGIYKVLLETSLSTTGAKYGYVILNSNKDKFVAHGLTTQELFMIQDFLSKAVKKDLTESYLIQNFIRSKLNHPTLVSKNIKSALLNPIFFKNDLIGMMCLFKELDHGFENESIEIVQSYVLQASISLENKELLKAAMANERYLEERKIAQAVKQRLLTDKVNLGEGIDVAVFSKSSDDVGGDFYDCYNYSNDKSIIILGDVSGNGTSAAFNMAQLKGVFQTAVRNTLLFDDIPSVMNQALYECLEKKSFITASLFLIDKKEFKIKHFRCGHNPSLFFSNNKIHHLNSAGIGLGIVKENKFSSLMQYEELNYKVGDVLLCYTDGFVEARGSDGDFFGVDGLEKILKMSQFLSAKDISKQIIDEFAAFTHLRVQEDDYSCFVIKFHSGNLLNINT